MSTSRIASLSTLLFLSLVTVLPQAHAGGDVLSLHDPGFVRVTQNADKSVTFEYCRESSGRDCSMLGHRQKYYLDELRTKRSKYNRQQIRMFISDGLFVIAGGALAGAGAAVTMSNPIGWGAIAATAAVGAGSSTTWTLRGYFNPDMTTAFSVRWKAGALDENFITDHCPRVKDCLVSEPSSEFASRLDKVLREVF